MNLRHKLYVSVSLPAGLGGALFYLAAIAEGDDALWIFRMGVTITLAAGVLGWVTWLAHQNRELRDEVLTLRATVRQLTEDHEDTRQAVKAHLAVKAWRQAGGTWSGRRLRPIRGYGEVN